MILAYGVLGFLVAFFLWEQYRQITKLNFVRRLIDTYEHDVDNPALIDAMYDFCRKDRKLKKIVAAHRATKEDFRMLYKKLLVRGNFRKYNRFVPISAFFATYTLDYLLKNKDASEFDLTKRMMNFFNI
ncbi:MAG: hypothetical protein ACTTKW_09805 [Schwartzia sp. (in: firmicutes)]